MAAKEADAEEWVTKHISIFVYHKEKCYCLHFSYTMNYFEILDVTKDAGTGVILKVNHMPTSLNPTNALEKLQTYLVFS